MSKHTSKLPSIKALATLEAVIRAGNIVAAANDLCVTPGAVSKQLAHLQEGLKGPLFEKGHRLRPTPLAIQLARAVGAGLRQIEAGWSAAVRENEKAIITLAANATMAFHWIVPQLVELERATDGRPVRVLALHSTDDWAQAQFDIAITRTPWHPEDWRRRKIGAEDLTLIAPPDRAVSLERQGPEAAVAETWLVADTRAGDLEAWCAAAGIGMPRTIRRIAHFYLAVQAAAAGQGCIVGPPQVLGDLIELGRLAVPFPGIRIEGARLAAIYDGERCTAALANGIVDTLFGQQSRRQPPG